MQSLLEAVSLAQAGDTKSAISAFCAVILEQPQSFEARFWLSMLYRRDGDFASALVHARWLAARLPSKSLVRSNLGLTLAGLGRHAEAVVEFSEAIRLDPLAGNNFLALAKSLQRLNRDEDALQTLATAGSTAEVFVARAQSLLNIGKANMAKTEALKALNLSPGDAEAELLLGGSLIELGETSAAEPHLEAAIRDGGPHVAAYGEVTRGMLFASDGHTEEARAAFERSIQVLPVQGMAYLALIRSGQVGESMRPVLEAMERLSSSGNMSPKDLSMLHYGLGKAFEDLEEFERSMDQYRQANLLVKSLKGAKANFNPLEYQSGIDRLIDLFPASLYRSSADCSLSDAPIFIVGMMRSGTTLVEQILSSHSQVAPGGERSFWMEALEGCRESSGRIEPARTRAAGNSYVQSLQPLMNSASHVTDKMPANYLRVGLIHLALPKAKFIHVKRDARDTCISIFTTPSSAVAPWLNDAGNIAIAYREYLKLMDHWKATIDPSHILTMKYEELVQSPELNTRRLLEFCQLAWEERCLRPEHNIRTVVTPSLWQVRRPIYRTSMSRWLRFRGLIDEFANLPHN